MGTKILDYDVFSGTKEELFQHIENFKKVNIISGNPQILYYGLNNEKLLESFTDETAVIVPDGVGTVIASKIVGNPVKEKIPGIEVMDSILQKSEVEGKGVYFVGAKQEVLDQCVENIKNKYPKLKICGSHNGYFDINNCDSLIEDIIKTEPYAIFVAMGAPMQENFIIKYMDTLPCKIFMGVGGSFDVFAGKVNRAPKWMIKFGLEWLYRVYKEPFRIKRLGVIPKFIFKVIIEKR